MCIVLILSDCHLCIPSVINYVSLKTKIFTNPSKLMPPTNIDKVKNMQGWKNLFKNISVYQKVKAIKTMKRKSSGDRFIKGRKLWT